MTETEQFALTTEPTDLPTNTPTLAPTSTLDPTQQAVFALAESGVTSNDQWTSYGVELDGISMVLVPAGCYFMGSEDRESNERPLYMQCFDQPFWLDQFEVTNEQYGSIGTLGGSNRPRETISWFDAQRYCESRGGRLPTEAEWEYAARGPSGSVYPWGNDFVADRTVYAGNTFGETSEVGSRPSGASWVGAMDMSGNVREWVSSIFEPYPFDRTDGRENFEDIESERVIRGGAWGSLENELRTAFRRALDPSTINASIGFRCARIYQVSKVSPTTSRIQDGNYCSAGGNCPSGMEPTCYWDNTSWEAVCTAGINTACENDKGCATQCFNTFGSGFSLCSHNDCVCAVWR